MRRAFAGLLVLWVLLLGAGRLAAHDLGFRTVTFQELEEGRYQLRYIARPGGAESQAPPALSKGLTWEQEPGLPQGLMTLAFNVDGRKLANDDRIFLPWRTRGMIVEAFWKNGESTRRVMAYDKVKGGFDIAIGDLRAGTPDMKEAAVHFGRLGLRHLLTGMEHLLCIAGLVFMAGRKGWRAAVAFAPGMVLMAAAVWACGWQPDRRMADVLVPLTLVFVALAMLRGPREVTAREGMGMGICFGAVHGLGFAVSLLDLGLPGGEMAVDGTFFLAGGVLGVVAVLLLCALVARAAAAISLRIPRAMSWAPGYALGIFAMVWSFQQGLLWFS